MTCQFFCLLVDKEEIGSVGATGMQSLFFENTVAELLDEPVDNYVLVHLLLCGYKSALPTDFDDPTTLSRY